MTTELYWLSLTLLMTALLWLPYILNRLAVRGVVKAVTDSKPETGATPTLWAQRAIRAHQNAVENLVIFAPAVLIAHAINFSSPTTKIAVMVYFFARLVHYVVYTLGIPVIRTLSFAVAWAATIAILIGILGA